MTMERGYLLILISAGISALSALGMINFAFGGYLLIAAGLHYLPTAAKELRTAAKFTYITLALSLGFTLFERILPSIFVFNPYVSSFGYIIYLFFSVGIFFWLLKAEYIWSPHARKRMDLLIYSGVALIYLLLNTFNVLSWLHIDLLMFNLNMGVNFFRISDFIDILYHSVLIFILAKLYLEARQNGSGLKRWN